MKVINRILLCISILVCNPLAYADEEAEKLKVYVNNLITDGYNIVNDANLPADEKVKRSSTLIRTNLHLDWMANYTLGRHKKSLSDAKIKEFTEVYSKFIVQAYADLSKNYSDVKAVVKKVNKVDDNVFLVSMEIFKKDSDSPVAVDYLVHKLTNAKQNPYKVGDIITEGVSILNSQQTEFDNVISNNGIDALISNLKEKLLKNN
ncbi:MAG: ABC transporter substrate-binding protein [Rickettsiaceae bacterium]|nr:ABC transporter substrate-binding protein [Rickettsiaceae bacterium]